MTLFKLFLTCCLQSFQKIPATHFQVTTPPDQNCKCDHKGASDPRSSVVKFPNVFSDHYYSTQGVLWALQLLRPHRVPQRGITTPNQGSPRSSLTVLHCKCSICQSPKTWQMGATIHPRVAQVWARTEMFWHNKENVKSCFKICSDGVRLLQQCKGSKIAHVTSYVFIQYCDIAGSKNKDGPKLSNRSLKSLFVESVL